MWPTKPDVVAWPLMEFASPALDQTPPHPPPQWDAFPVLSWRLPQAGGRPGPPGFLPLTEGSLLEPGFWDPWLASLAHSSPSVKCPQDTCSTFCTVSSFGGPSRRCDTEGEALETLGLVEGWCSEHKREHVSPASPHVCPLLEAPGHEEPPLQGSGCSGPPGTAPSPSPSGRLRSSLSCPRSLVSSPPDTQGRDSEPGCVRDLLEVTWVPLFAASLWGLTAFSASQPWDPCCHKAVHVRSYLLGGTRPTGV